MQRPLLAAIACVASWGCSPPSNPVIRGNQVTISIPAPEGVVPSVTGDFTAWTPMPASPAARGNWYTYSTTLEPDARVEYLIVFGPQDVRVDPLNPRRVPSVGGDASEIVMPGAEAQPELAGTEAPLGTFDEHTFTVPAGARTAVVYRPAQTRAAMPVVYFQDGALMIARGVPQIIDALVSGGRLVPLTAVFVEPVSRADDYKASPEFRSWFVGTLLPEVERTLEFVPTVRAVVGVSRGAAAALDIAWNHPETFGRCGLLIPTTSPTDLTQQIARAPRRPVQVAIVAARYDAQWLDEARVLRQVLDANDYDVVYREVPEGHNVQTWRAHLDDVLIGLRLGPAR
jgi:enterochelin esterase family protein